jgi:hypothetical protein
MQAVDIIRNEAKGGRVGSPNSSAERPEIDLPTDHLKDTKMQILASSADSFL